MNENKDVLRVFEAEATTDAALRTKMIGGGTDTFRLVGKFASGAKHYAADEVAATYTAKRTILLAGDQLRLANSAEVFADLGVDGSNNLAVKIGATTAATVSAAGLAVVGKTTTAQLKITTGATANSWLKSDANGDATWAALSASSPLAYDSATGAFTHLDTAGNKHVPAGTAGRVPYWSSSGVLSASPVYTDGSDVGVGGSAVSGIKLHVQRATGNCNVYSNCINDAQARGSLYAVATRADGATSQAYGELSACTDGVTATTSFGLNHAGLAYLRFYPHAAYAAIGTMTAADFILGTNNAERMRIYSGGTGKFIGRFGIGGEPDGTAMLKVTGTSYFDGSVGVGVATSAWWSSSKQLQVSSRIALSGVAAAGDWLTCNAYQSASGVWTHLVASSSAPVSVGLGIGANAFKFSVNNDGSGGDGTITWRDRFDILIAEAGGFKFYLPTDDLTILDFDIGALGNGYIKVNNGSVTGYVTIQSTLPTVS